MCGVLVLLHVECACDLAAAECATAVSFAPSRRSPALITAEMDCNKHAQTSHRTLQEACSN